MQWQRGNFTLDDDRARLDMGIIKGWLQNTYWASGRSADEIELSWQLSVWVYGLYDGDKLIGCARVLSDTISIAYLGDVFIDEAYRGQGLSLWMVQTIVQRPEASKVRWILYTRDAHELYSRFGFERRDERLMERPRDGEIRNTQKEG